MLEGLHTTVKGLKGLVDKIWMFLVPLFPAAAPFAILLALLGAIDANYTTLVSGINGLAAHVAGMPAAGWLGQANRIIPITEILAMLLALLTLRIAATVVRFIKSWIPTVN